MRRSLATAIICAASVSATAARTRQGDAIVTISDPPQAHRIPALEAWLELQDGGLRAGVEGEAAAARRDAAKEGRPFDPYRSTRTWKIVAETPRFLSLSVDRYDYTGGAHGEIGFGAIVWDKWAAAPRPPLTFFVSQDRLRDVIRAAFCRRLDAERRRKRGSDAGADPAFAGCIDPVAETIILGSTDRRRFDRIGILIPPYAAGPYVEGAYEVTLPVTSAILSVVRPKWRGYFAPGPASTGAP